MDTKELRCLMEAYVDVYAPQEVDELYKGKHGQSDKEYADSRSQGGKMISGTSKMSGAEYTHGRRVRAANPGMQPDVGGKTKPKSQGKMDAGTRADLQYRKANLKKEELDIFDVVLEFLYAEGYVETLEEAEWMMANLIDEEAIAIILDEGKMPLDKERRVRIGTQIGKRIDSAGKDLAGSGAPFMPKSIRNNLRQSAAKKGGEVNKMVGALKSAQKYAKEEYEEEFAIDEADSIAAMRERAAKRRKQRYGASDTSLGGRDDFRPYTKADYERGAANDPRKKVKEAFKAWLDEAMSNYEKNRKRAAQRAAARNAARDAGKTGVVPGVGYVTPRRERETWTDESGKTRHAKGL